MSNRTVWVDIPVIDLDRAIAFYSAVLGEPVTKEGGPGFAFGLLPHAEGEAGPLPAAPTVPSAAHAAFAGPVGRGRG